MFVLRWSRRSYRVRPVADRYGEDRTPRDPADSVDKRAAHGFADLKALLSDVSANFKVRFRFLPRNLLLTASTQKTAGIGRKAENLCSRVALLEEHFGTPPGNVAEQNHRAEVIRYGVVLSIGLDTELLPASSRPLEPSCSFCLRNLNHDNPLTPPKSETFLGSLKVFERSSSITRFVRDPGIIAHIDMGNR